jgi:hypothetical protein
MQSLKECVGIRVQYIRLQTTIICMIVKSIRISALPHITYGRETSLKVEILDTKLRIFDLNLSIRFGYYPFSRLRSAKSPKSTHFLLHIHDNRSPPLPILLTPKPRCTLPPTSKPSSLARSTSRAFPHTRCSRSYISLPTQLLR